LHGDRRKVNNSEAAFEIHKTKFIILEGRVIDKRSCRKVEKIKGILVIFLKGEENEVKHQSTMQWSDTWGSKKKRKRE